MGWLWFSVLGLSLYGVATLERWSSTGRLRYSLFYPSLNGLRLLRRQATLPAQRDKIFFEIAPPILLLAAVLAAVVLPIAPGSVGVNLASGGLFINAALAYVMVAVVMAGWAPNGNYAMIGGWRFLGQLVAYVMPIVMTITAVTMRSQSLGLNDIVASQSNLWNIAAQPLGFGLFYLSAMALAFLSPFDLPQSYGELMGGALGEYSGWHLAIIRFGRLLVITVLGLSISVLFLGGWQGPLLPPWLWSVLKTLAVAASMLWLGRAVPRLQFDRLLAGAWKVAIPLALINIFLTGILLLTEVMS